MNSRPAQNFKLQKSEHPWREGLRTMGLSLSLVFGIRVAIGQCYFISSGSMEPTLEINDQLLVDKLSYRFQNPQRGNIVLFTPPEVVVKQEHSHAPYIKRIIGLPGETVEVKGGQVYINNIPLKENYLTDKPNYTWGPQTVPLNSYLVLGDNRNQSYDSHYWGFVPRDRLIGRALLRFLPLKRVGVFSTDGRS